MKKNKSRGSRAHLFLTMLSLVEFISRFLVMVDDSLSV